MSVQTANPLYDHYHAGNDAGIVNGLLPSSDNLTLFKGFADDGSDRDVGELRIRPQRSRLQKARTFIFECTISLGMGIVFGLVLDRSGVMYPAVIRTQFIWTNFAMIKMWLAAVAASAICFFGFYKWNSHRFDKARLHRPWGDKGFFTCAIGGFVQGIGMAFCGACPGMTLGQIGSQVPDAWIVLLGGITGALVHSFFDNWIARARVKDFSFTFKKVFRSGFFDLTWRWRYDLIVLPFVLFLAGVIAAFEIPFNWTTDLIGVAGIRTPETGLINPTLAGVCVGLLQLPAYLLLGSNFLGTSTGYSVIVSQCYWQITFVIGALLGGLISYVTSVPSTPIRGVGPAFAAVGGFFLVFGARIAGGCASGHGLTGLSLFSVSGWTVVPFMFGGAIVTGFITSAAIGEANYSLTY